jgi:hypothetical protein
LIAGSDAVPAGKNCVAEFKAAAGAIAPTTMVDADGKTEAPLAYCQRVKKEWR